MVSRRTDRLLNSITHHTNLEHPYSNDISSIIFPAQNSNKLGRTVKLRYVNRYIPDVNYTDDTSPEEYESSMIIDNENDELIRNIFEDEFIIIRYDLSSPFKIIFLSVDYKVMLIGDSRTYNDSNRVFKYPKQIEEYIGLYMNNRYSDSEITRSVLFSCDSTEPGYSIIAEFYIDNTVRFLLDTEVESVVFERYELKNRDFNGMDPEDHESEYTLIDLNGKYPSSEGEPIYINADGGYPDPLQDMYRKDILTPEEVCKLRGKIITERRIWGSPGITPRAIELNSYYEEIYQNGTFQLEATLIDPTIPFKTVTWRSTDNNLTSVDQNGLVTAHGSGRAYIYAIATDVWARCTIDAKIHTSGVIIDTSSFNILLGEERQLTATVSPINATNKNVIWSSSDINVLIVNENGLVKAVGTGSATITCKTEEGTFEDTCSVIVYSNYVPVSSVNITNISGDPKRISLSTNARRSSSDEFVVEVEVLPANATDKNIYARVANPQEDFAVYVENITETKFRIKALCDCMRHPNVVEVYSHDNPDKKDIVFVTVTTNLESISISSNQITLDPEFSESIDTHADLDINFYPINNSINPEVKVGPNIDQVESVLNTLEIYGQGTAINVENTESYLINKCISNRLSIDAGDPGIGRIKVTDLDGTDYECRIIVGESGISRFELKNVPSDWSKFKPGDEFTVDLDVDPEYWYEFPDLYSITWAIYNNDNNAIEIINNITSITVKIKDQCENVSIIGTTNSGLTAEFAIDKISIPFISLDIDPSSTIIDYMNDQIIINYYINRDYLCPSNPKIYWNNYDTDRMAINKNETNDQYGTVIVTGITDHAVRGSILIESDADQYGHDYPFREEIEIQIGRYATSISTNTQLIEVPGYRAGIKTIEATCNGINGVVSFDGTPSVCTTEYNIIGTAGRPNVNNTYKITPVAELFDQLEAPGSITIRATCNDSAPDTNVYKDIIYKYGNKLSNISFANESISFDIIPGSQPKSNCTIVLNAIGENTNYPPSVTLNNISANIYDTNIISIDSIAIYTLEDKRQIVISCTAKDLGDTVISVDYVKDGETYTITKAINIYGIKFSNPIESIEIRDEYILNYETHLPGSAQLEYYSNPEGVVEISSSGVLKGIGPGTTTVSVKVQGTNYIDSFTIETIYNYIESFYINTSPILLENSGSSANVGFILSPDDAADIGIDWSCSSNLSINPSYTESTNSSVNITANNVPRVQQASITGVTRGITSSGDHLTRTFNNIQIGRYATAINIIAGNEIIYPENNTYINTNTILTNVDGICGIINFDILDSGAPFTINAQNLGNGDWSAAINQYGTINNYGSSTIKLTAEDSETSGAIYRTVNLKWGNRVTSYEIEDASTDINNYINNGDFPSTGNIKANLLVEYSDYNATIKNTYWHSSDTDILTLGTPSINRNKISNVFNCIKPGSAIITTTSQDGNFSDQRTINVYGIIFHSTSYSINMTDRLQLSPDFNLPSGSNIYYTTNNREIIETEYDSTLGTYIIRNGLVIPKKAGTCTIQAHSTGSHPLDSNTININISATGNPLVDIHFSNNTYNEYWHRDRTQPYESNYLTTTVKFYLVGLDPDNEPAFDISNVDFTVRSAGENIAEFVSATKCSGIGEYDIVYRFSDPGTVMIYADCRSGSTSFTSNATLNCYGIKRTQSSIAMMAQDVLDLASYTNSYLPTNTSLVYVTYNNETGATGFPSEYIRTDNQGIIANGIVETIKDGNEYIKIYCSTDTDLYDVIMIDVNNLICTDIEFIHNYPDEIDKFYLRDNTESRIIYFKQMSGQSVLVSTTPVQDVKFDPTDNNLNITEIAPSANNYAGATISMKDVAATGDTYISVTSYDGNVTKTFPVHYGNELLDFRFPNNYAEFGVEINNIPADNTLVLYTTTEYTGYKPSSTCVWASSDTNVVTVDRNGYMAKSSPSSEVNFYTTYNI